MHNPPAILDDRLTLADVRVLAVLCAAPPTPFDPGPVALSKSAIAAAARITPRAAFRSVSRLAEVGHIKSVETLGPRGERQYEITARVDTARGIVGKRLYDLV